MQIVPFHCLVFCSPTETQRFAGYERVSLQAVAADLLGEDRRDLHAIVFAELCHRVGLKLSLGQRVAIGDALTSPQRQQLTSIAISQGASVIDWRPETDLAACLPTMPQEHLRTHWKGITVVGDVHGEQAAMHKALQWATARHHFVWLLGDVIDYGADTLTTAEMAYRLVMRGDGAIIIGNHERKIARWLDQCEAGRPHVRLNDGNRVTVATLNRLKPVPRKQWIGRFRALLGHATLLQQIDNITLLHGAAHPSLWSEANSTMIEQFALYGEADYGSGKFRRAHHWIDAVPAGQLVFVGHDVVNQFPTIVTGAKGGQVVFLDTGSGIGGHLSTADLRFTDTGLRLECFNRH